MTAAVAETVAKEEEDEVKAAKAEVLVYSWPRMLAYTSMLLDSGSPSAHTFSTEWPQRFQLRRRTIAKSSRSCRRLPLQSG